MGLSNYQLVLLDNLIYLDTVANFEGGEFERTIGKVVDTLLYASGSTTAGTGTIAQDCINTYQGGDSPNCLMTKEEWIQVLQAIEADKTLCSLTIHTVESDRENGFRAMALTGDNVDENIIIFKGTTSAYEWIDNGIGGYSVETPNQERALAFVEGLDIVNNKTFVTSGHSKGGNLAQYVALHSDNPPIDKCLNFDGQGFSEEACATEEYQTALAEKGSNLYLVAACGDYVNVLFNSPVSNNHKMYLDADTQGESILHYHKPNIIFNIQSGKVIGLNNTTTINLLSYFVQEFIDYIQKTETDVENKKQMYDGIMGILAASADPNDDLEVGVPKMNRQLVILLASSASLACTEMGLGNGVNVANDIRELFTSEEYRGELYEFMDEGTISLMLKHLCGFIVESTNNVYSMLSLLAEVIEGETFDTWLDAGMVLLNNSFFALVDIFDTSTGYSLEKFNEEVLGTKATTTTLGEGTTGTIYKHIDEEGGMYCIGSGRSNSIRGTVTNDSLYGGNGCDTLRGDMGNDRLVGGRGDDSIIGGSGIDTYVFHRYDGKDVIDNSELSDSVDVVEFAADIDIEDVVFETGDIDSGSEKNLVIKVGDESTITIINFFATDGDGNLDRAIDFFRFKKNGQVLTLSEVCRMAGAGAYHSTADEEELADVYEKLINGEDLSGSIADKGASGENLDTETPPYINPEWGEEEENSSDGSSGETSADSSTGTSGGHGMAEIGDYFGDFSEAMIVRPKDPLIIDLNGDDVFTTTLEEGTYFDYNGDGFAEKTAWVSQGDGLLVRDVNGNGSIDDGSELFGDRTMLSDGTFARSGFDALEDLDSNQDGVINNQDTEYASLRVWMDFDMDGKSAQRELYSLGSLGIEEIVLVDKSKREEDENGNLITAESTTNGSDTYTVKEYRMNIDYSDTEYRGDLTDTSTLDEGTPQVSGSGTLLDLSQAMVLNEELKVLVDMWLAESDFYMKGESLHQILYTWAKVENVETDSRGSWIDARSLGVIEKVCGTEFVGSDGAKPNSEAAKILKKIYNNIHMDVWNSLLSQTMYKAALEQMNVFYDQTSATYTCDFVSVYNTLLKECSEFYVAHFTHYILEHTIVGEHFTKTAIYEQLNNSEVKFATLVLADNYYVVADDVDSIKGTAQQDLLVGGVGEDTLYGKDGDDIYLFNLGDGKDTIIESEGVDRIVFGEGIAETDILVSRGTYHLYLTNTITGDRVTIKDIFHYNGRQIEVVEFVDGTKWSFEDLKDKARYYYGTEEDEVIVALDSKDVVPTYEEDYMYGGAGDDTMYGHNGADEMYGEAGADFLYGQSEDDILVGGTGEDEMRGGEGNDTYVFHIGDGKDKILESEGTDQIVFGEGIAETDILVSRSDYNLYLTNSITGDRITVKEFFRYDGKQIETIEFADGTKWSFEDLKDKARYYYGTEEDEVIGASDSLSAVPICEDDYIYAGAGDDTIYGRNGADELYGEAGDDKLYGGVGDDRLSGGTGDDKLYGGAGDDTYSFNLGDGEDTVTDSEGTDRIVFGQDITSEDLMFSKKGDDLLISILGTEDVIRISDYYDSDADKVEVFQTSDGYSLDYTKVDVMIQAMASFEDTTGMMWEDAIRQQNEQANDIVNQWWTKDVV